MYEVTDDNEKGLMITSASYATPRNPEPIYWELEPEYDRPTTSLSATKQMDRRPSSIKRAHVSKKTNDIVASQEKNHNTVQEHSSPTPCSSQDDDGLS